MIPFGMRQVSSVHMIAQAGNQISKGGEFGYFMFGKSDIIFLFQEGKAPKIGKTSNYRHYGTSLSISPVYGVAYSK